MWCIEPNYRVVFVCTMRSFCVIRMYRDTRFVWIQKPQGYSAPPISFSSSHILYGCACTERHVWASSLWFIFSPLDSVSCTLLLLCASPLDFFAPPCTPPWMDVCARNKYGTFFRRLNSSAGAGPEPAWPCPEVRKPDIHSGDERGGLQQPHQQEAQQGSEGTCVTMVT